MSTTKLEHAHMVMGADGEPRVVRTKNGKPTSGRLVPLRDGQPIGPGGEIVSVKALGGSCVSVETLYATSGPPQVATEDYRKGWDAIWGGKRKHDVN